MNSRVVCLAILLSSSALCSAQAHLGFDRNGYPGDANIPALRKTFSYIGYWLNNPPGGNANSWAGKRSLLTSAGFGFLILFNGKLEAQLGRNPSTLGQSDGQQAVASAKREGFPAHAIIFLDLEEGGRMSDAQKAYIYAWVDAVNGAGFRAGVYCSGIPVREDRNTTVVSADDIRSSAKGRAITYWVVNDSCPPSPGCSVAGPQNPSASGISYAEIWQFVRSPRSKESAGKCVNYNRDENCYPPGIEPALGLHIDLNTATSTDPSGGR